MLGRLLAWPLVVLVRLYRLLISPWLGINCRFQPTCSTYAIEALTHHGAFRGGALAAKRIARCHPWGGQGYDPVPVRRKQGELERRRKAVLNHAYGLMSRDNREGGLQHLIDWLAEDPEGDAAWAWFLERILSWEDTDQALLFAQRYVSRLLSVGAQVQAVKLILRCRLRDERFKPAAEDRETAIEAAESCGNRELASVLRRL